MPKRVNGQKEMVFNPPSGLDRREHAAFRLGLLTMLIESQDHGELVHPMPGIYLESLKTEREYRLEELEDIVRES